MPVTHGPASAPMPTPPDVVLVAGSDKLTIYSFARFLSSTAREHRLGLPLHSLMSPQACGEYTDAWLPKNPKSILTWYTKRHGHPEPLGLIPSVLAERCGLVLWFELYATEPRVLKDRFPEHTAWLLAGWKARVGA